MCLSSETDLPKVLTFLLHLICISLDFSHRTLRRVLLPSPLGTLSDPGIPHISTFHTNHFILTRFDSDWSPVMNPTQCSVTVSQKLLLHRWGCLGFWRTTSGKHWVQDVLMIFVQFPLLCPRIYLILTASGNASDRRYKWILHCIITYFTVRKNWDWAW